MKIGKIAWLILGIGIFAIAGFSLYLLYQDQVDEQESVNQSLLAAEASLPALISEKEALKSQLTQLVADLAQAEDRLDEAEGRFPDSIVDATYGDLLFTLAGGLNLKVTSFTSTGPSGMVQDGISYEATSFMIVVEGELEAILQYITKIQVETDFRTTTIDVVNINIVATAAGEEDGKSSASISLKIVSYRGS